VYLHPTLEGSLDPRALVTCRRGGAGTGLSDRRDRWRPPSPRACQGIARCRLFSYVVNEANLLPQIGHLPSGSGVKRSRAVERSEIGARAQRGIAISRSAPLTARGGSPSSPSPQATFRSGRSKRTARRGTSEPRARGERADRGVTSAWPGPRVAYTSLARPWSPGHPVQRRAGSCSAGNQPDGPRRRHRHTECHGVQAAQRGPAACRAWRHRAGHLAVRRRPEHRVPLRTSERDRRPDPRGGVSRGFVRRVSKPACVDAALCQQDGGVEELTGGGGWREDRVRNRLGAGALGNHSPGAGEALGGSRRGAQ